MKPVHKPKKGSAKPSSSWGGVASWYDELLEKDGDTYQQQVILPNLMRVLALKRGEQVIDIACGQGFFTRACAAAGAKVAGADISKELVALAKKQPGPAIEFYATPAHQLDFAPTGTYDTAIIVLAIQNIENMEQVFAEAARVLKPAGRLVLVLNHPAFRVPKRSSWGYDEASKTQYRRVDRYLSAEKVTIDMHPGTKGGEQTLSFHRSLQDITKALHKNHFAIARLEEWISHRESEPGPRQNAENTARKEFPLFLMLEGKKMPG